MRFVTWNISHSIWLWLCFFLPFLQYALIQRPSFSYRDFFLVFIHTTQTVMRTMWGRKSEKEWHGHNEHWKNDHKYLYVLAYTWPLPTRILCPAQTNIRKYLNYFLIFVYQHHFLCLSNRKPKKKERDVRSFIVACFYRKSI